MSTKAKKPPLQRQLKEANARHKEAIDMCLRYIAHLHKAETQRDEARAEVERLSKLEDSLPGSLRDAHAVVEGLRAELRTVAERQREACELYLRHRAEEIIDDGGERELAIALHRAADRVEDTPLVTEGEEKP